MNEKKMCIDADDEPCEYFQEETGPEEPGNNKD